MGAVRKRATGQLCLMKVMKKSDCNSIDEVGILRRLQDHVFLPKFYQAFDTVPEISKDDVGDEGPRGCGAMSRRQSANAVNEAAEDVGVDGQVLFC
jgi:hypothetical protein